MTALLLEPHQDDAALFAAFTCIRHRPHVVTVLRSVVQEQRRTGITQAIRQAENDDAMSILGCTWEQWPHPDSAPDWEAVRRQLEEIDTPSLGRVFAPCPEDGGQPHHNMIGELAEAVFGAERVSFYMTYVDGRVRNGGRPVEYEPGWIQLKLRALACYRSQHDLASTGHHFLAAQHEFLRP